MARLNSDEFFSRLEELRTEVNAFVYSDPDKTAKASELGAAMMESLFPDKEKSTVSSMTTLAALFLLVETFGAPLLAKADEVLTPEEARELFLTREAI